MLLLGIIGEYLGRLYTESKQRPLFVIAEVVRSRAQSRALPNPIAIVEHPHDTPVSQHAAKGSDLWTQAELRPFDTRTYTARFEFMAKDLVNHTMLLEKQQLNLRPPWAWTVGWRGCRCRASAIHPGSDRALSVALSSRSVAGRRRRLDRLRRVACNRGSHPVPRFHRGYGPRHVLLAGALVQGLRDELVDVASCPARYGYRVSIRHPLRSDTALSGETGRSPGGSLHPPYVAAVARSESSLRQQHVGASGIRGECLSLPEPEGLSADRNASRLRFDHHAPEGRASPRSSMHCKTDSRRPISRVETGCYSYSLDGGTISIGGGDRCSVLLVARCSLRSRIREFDLARDPLPFGKRGAVRSQFASVGLGPIRAGVRSYTAMAHIGRIQRSHDNSFYLHRRPAVCRGRAAAFWRSGRETGSDSEHWSAIDLLVRRLCAICVRVPPRGYVPLDFRFADSADCGHSYACAFRADVGRHHSAHPRLLRCIACGHSGIGWEHPRDRDGNPERRDSPVRP